MTTIACADYHAHQFSHRHTAAGWVCDACNPPTAAAERPQALMGTPDSRTGRERVPEPTEQAERQSVPERRDVNDRPEPHVPPTALNRPASPGSDTFRFLTSRPEAPIYAQSARSAAAAPAGGHSSGHRER
jgi:hypothetical protein